MFFQPMGTFCIWQLERMAVQIPLLEHPAKDSDAVYNFSTNQKLIWSKNSRINNRIDQLSFTILRLIIEFTPMRKRRIGSRPIGMSIRMHAAICKCVWHTSFERMNRTRKVCFVKLIRVRVWIKNQHFNFFYSFSFSIYIFIEFTNIKNKTMIFQASLLVLFILLFFVRFNWFFFAACDFSYKFFF